MPLEGAISRTWLEFWQPKLQSVVYQHSVKVNVDPEKNSERADIGILVDIISGTVQKIQGLADNDLQVPPELTVLSFLGVMRSLSKDNPAVRQVLNRSAEKLAHIVTVIQKPVPPVDDMQTAPTK